MRAVAAFLCAAVCASCIERAPQPRQKRQVFDRSSVSELIVPAIPPGARPVGARFGAGGEQVELAAMAADPPNPRAGSTVQITFFYRVLDNEPDEDWQVFVHIDDRSGRAERVNRDHWPTGYGAPWATSGRYPMSNWRRGEIIRDTWSFSIPGHVDADALDVWTGFWNPFRGDRLPLTNAAQIANDGQNRIMAGSLALRGN